MRGTAINSQFFLADTCPFAAYYRESFNVVQDENGCTELIHEFDPLIHKPKYTIGVYANEGEDKVFEKYNLTFAEYLTETAGRKFNPPIEFGIVPVNLTALMALADEDKADFFFATSAVASCMATEYQSQLLVTITARRETRGRSYDLDQYGGVIFTLADNERVNGIADLKDSIIGAGGVTMLGGGQTQFYTMFENGLSYVADPKQVIFTGNEELTVQGVLEGKFEVGMARTDQIERHRDANGEPLDPNTFKVINAQTHVLDDGRLFPFLASTNLHAEWPVGALSHVDKNVAREVQEALLAIREHKASLELGQNVRCDTTPALANLSATALDVASAAGFRTARNYFTTRTEQEAAGFLRLNKSDGKLHCIRGETLYHDISCPTGTSFQLQWCCS